MAGHSYSSRGASFVPEWWEKGVPDGIKAGTLMPVLFRLFCENVLCPLSTQEGSSVAARSILNAATSQIRAMSARQNRYPTADPPTSHEQPTPHRAPLSKAALTDRGGRTSRRGRVPRRRCARGALSRPSGARLPRIKRPVDVDHLREPRDASGRVQVARREPWKDASARP
jgi:hypothetical protein